MNKEQNIDDILKLLKSSFSEGEAEGDTAVDTPKNDGGDGDKTLTHDELQERLKQQFMSGEQEKKISDDYESDSFSYTLDSDFLAESVSEQNEDTEEAPAEQDTAKDEDNGIPPFDIEEEDLSISETAEEEDDGLPPFDLVEDELSQTEDDGEEIVDGIDDEDTEDGIFIENEEGEIILLKSETDAEGYTEEHAMEDDGVLSMLGDFEESVSKIGEEIEEVEETIDKTEEIIEDDSPELYSREGGQLALFEQTENSEEETVAEIDDAEEMSRGDELQLAMDFEGDDIDEAHIEQNTAESSAEISDSVLGLMFEFGDVSAAGAPLDRERVNAYANKQSKSRSEHINPTEAFAFDGEEFERKEQTEELYAKYMHEKYFTLLRVLGCGLFAVIMLAYELVGYIGVDLEYMKYTSVYTLIGMQILVLSALFGWRELISGIRRAFTFKAGRWSLVALIFIFTVVYDIAVIAIGAKDIPHMFGTVACAYLFFGILICIFNWVAIRKHLRYRQEVKRTFLIPFISSVLMGVVSRILYNVLYVVMGENKTAMLISLVIAIVIAVLVYFAAE